MDVVQGTMRFVRQGMTSRIDEEKEEDKKEDDDEEESVEDELLEQKAFGGYDAEILGKESELKEFECPICCNTMRRATETDCGHLFCESCIKSWLKIKQKCPICKSKIAKHSSSFYFRNKISRLQAKCRCGKILHLKMLDAHQNVCKDSVSQYSQLSRKILKDKRLLEARLQKHEQRLQSHDDIMGFMLMVGFGIAIWKTATKVYQWLQD